MVRNISGVFEEREHRGGALDGTPVNGKGVWGEGCVYFLKGGGIRPLYLR